MKGWLALHENKWHPIKDVVDTGKPAHEEGGGNVYHLEGVKEPVHQSKIKDMKPDDTKKCDMVEITSDGKQELVEGKEPLKKDPKIRWNKLKKALNHTSAFMDIEEAMKPDEEKNDAQLVPPPEDTNQEGEDVPNQDSSDKNEEENKEIPDQESVNESEDESVEGYSDSEAEEKIIQALKDEGYSDPEIAFIVHGHHAPEISETDAAKAQATSDMSNIDTEHAKRQADLEHEHTKRMNDLEHEKAKNEIADPETEKNHRKRMLDLEYETAGSKKKAVDIDLEHQKRMKDLEYNKAERESSHEDPTNAIKAKQMEFELEMKRKEKELELEYKKKELELKLKLTEEAAKQKAEHAARQAEEDAKINAQIKKEQAKHKVAAAKEPPKPVKPVEKNNE